MSWWQIILISLGGYLTLGVPAIVIACRMESPLEYSDRVSLRDVLFVAFAWLIWPFVLCEVVKQNVSIPSLNEIILWRRKPKAEAAPIHHAPYTTAPLSPQPRFRQPD